MRRTSTDPEFIRIQVDFDSAKLSCAQDLAAIGVERRHVINSNWRSWMFLIVVTLVCVGVIAACIFLFRSLGTGGILIDIIIIRIAGGSLMTLRERVEAAIERSCQDELQQLEKRADAVRHVLAAAEAHYDRDCISYRSYPPDWESRRQTVIKRDGGCCIKCGWPTGVKRRARELHVHHVVSLSRSGDNSLQNLVTLCHICHRAVGDDHRLVRNNSKGRGRGYQ